jgi:hypothetical protein
MRHGRRNLKTCLCLRSVGWNEQQDTLIFRVLRLRTSWFSKFAGLLGPFSGEGHPNVRQLEPNFVMLKERKAK